MSGFVLSPLIRGRGLCAALGLGLVLIAGCGQGDSGAATSTPAATAGKGYKAIDITGANYAQVLELTDPRGKRRSLSEFKGKLIVVFFGYTQCPDVCPTTMAELAEARTKLGADADRIQGIFVSVDPQRDTPAVLDGYVGSFGPGFIAVTGTPDEVLATAKHFKVYFAKVPGKTENTYTIDHTAGSYVFDAQGKVRLFTRYGVGADALAADLKRLLAEPAASR